MGVVRTTEKAALAQCIANILGTTASETFSDSFGLPSPRRDVLSKPKAQDVFQVFNNSAIIAKTWFNPAPSQINPLIIESIVDMNTRREQPQRIIANLEDRINDFLQRRR